MTPQQKKPTDRSKQNDTPIEGRKDRCPEVKNTESFKLDLGEKYVQGEPQRKIEYDTDDRCRNED